MSFFIRNLPDGTLLPDKGKEFMLITEAAAHLIQPPDTFVDDLVCIVHDDDADCAVYCFSEGEMNFYIRYEGKSKTWLLVPDAAKIAK